MKRIALKIEYDGTSYAGWQRQVNAMTIQQRIEDALKDTLGLETPVIGAGRTDAGVHARGQVAHFDTGLDIPGDRYAFILNQKLPPDIRIRESRECASSFHARKSAIGKHYRYTLFVSRQDTAIFRNFSCHIPVKLDLEKMKEAATFLEGEHDFSAFRAAGSNIVGTVRTIYDLTVTGEGDLIHIDVTGNGFLYNMVRIIAGTLTEVGKGKLEPEKVREILEIKDRTLAGMTMPAKGLIMEEVFYDRDRLEQYLNNKE